MFTLTVVSAVAAVVAAIAGILGYLQARPTAPFRTERIDDDTIALIRTRRPQVAIFEVYVLGVRPLVSVDMAATTSNRRLKRHGELLLNVSGIPLGNNLIVRYRREWRSGSAGMADSSNPIGRTRMWGRTLR